MQDHYNYLKCKNLPKSVRYRKRILLMEIRNYDRRFTVYMLVCNITGDTYFGSTCMTLKRRLYGHKNRTDCASKIIIDRGDYLPLIPLETNLTYCEKKEREDWYICNHACVNKYNAKCNPVKRKLSNKKSKIKNREKNKEKVKIYNAKYSTINREKLTQKRAEWCEKNKQHTISYNHWKRTHPIGILARAYFT